MICIAIENKKLVSSALIVAISDLELISLHFLSCSIWGRRLLILHFSAPFPDATSRAF